MTRIHPTAIIDDSAQIGTDVEIGPYCVIGANTSIGNGTVLKSHVVIEPYTTIGKECQIWPGVVLGGYPQDYKFQGGVSYVNIGDNVILRESVTVNRATNEGGVTRVGNGSMMMAYSHVGHNSEVGQEVVIANAVQIAGHVSIGDYSFLGGSCVFHQFTRVGRYCIVGGYSATRQDIPPFAMADGRPAYPHGLNKVGLKRRGFTLEQRTRLKQAYKILWFSGLSMSTAIARVREAIPADPHVDELLTFIETSKRGIKQPPRKAGHPAESNGETAELTLI